MRSALTVRDGTHTVQQQMVSLCRVFFHLAHPSIHPSIYIQKEWSISSPSAPNLLNCLVSLKCRKRKGREICGTQRTHQFESLCAQSDAFLPLTAQVTGLTRGICCGLAVSNSPPLHTSQWNVGPRRTRAICFMCELAWHVGYLGPISP